MFIELVYDKRNVAQFPKVAEIIKSELIKCVHHFFTTCLRQAYASQQP